MNELFFSSSYTLSGGVMIPLIWTIDLIKNYFENKSLTK